MVETRSASKKAATPALAPLDANTPALRAAQRELKAKAILSIELSETEATLAKLVQRKKTVADHAAAVLGKIDASNGANFREKCLRQGFEMLHHQGRGLSMPGTCESAWKNTGVAMDIYDKLEKTRERTENEWEKATEELRVVRMRRDCAVRCAEVLRACLAEVRERQQGAT